MKNYGKLFILILAVLVFALAFTACGDDDHTHSFGEWTVADADKPASDKAGVAKKVCECGETETLTIPKLTDSGYTITNNTAAVGVTGTGTYTITISGNTVSFTAPTPALPEPPPHVHSYGSWTVADADKPTADSEGKARRKCSCGEAEETLTLPVLTDKSYLITDNTAAAGVAGTGKYSIVISGVSISFTAATPALPVTHTHSYGEWTVAAADTPTADAVGKATKSCACGNSFELELPALTDPSYVITDDTAAPGIAGTGTYTITVNEVTVSFTAPTPALKEYEEVKTFADFNSALSLAGGSGSGFKPATDITVGKFTFGAGCYFEDTNTKYFDNGNVNTQKKNIYFSVSGEINSITFDARGASGSGCVITVYKIGDGGEELIYTGENIENGTLVEAIELTALEAGRYVIKTSGSARIGDMFITEKLEKSEPKSIEIAAANNKFLAGRDITADGVTVTLVYENGRRDTLTASAYTTTIASVDKYTAGKYTVTVTHTDTGFTADYTVIVYGVDSITVSDHSLDSKRVTLPVQKIYLAGSTYDNFASAAVVASCSSPGVEETETFVLLKGEYTFAPATDDNKKITVTVANDIANAENVNASYDIEIISPSSEAVKTEIHVDHTAQVGEDPVTHIITVKTIRDALKLFELLDAPEGERKTVVLAAGEYFEKVEVSLPNISIVAKDGVAAEDIVIVYDALNGLTDPSGISSYSTDGSATISVRESAEGFYAKGITIKNYYNTHALYEESKSIAGSGTQAVACLVRADKVIFENVRFSSYHDTLYAENGRHIYKNCYIEGRTDYIFGNDATAYFTGCTIMSIGAGLDEKNGGYVVATKGGKSGANVEYGYIFNNCSFIGDENVQPGSVSIARGWDKYMTVMVMNSTLDDSFSLEAYGNTESPLNDRYTKMNADPVASQLFEYNNTGDGALTQAMIDGAVDGLIANICTIPTEAVANNYQDFSKIFAQKNGSFGYDDAWNGEIEIVSITVQLGEETLGSFNTYKGSVITLSDIEEAIAEKLPEGKALTGLYTDTELKNKYELTTIASITVYADLTDTDPTVKESVTYTVSDFKEIAAGDTGAIGKLQIVGAFAPNGDWFKLLGEGSITLTLKAGTSVTLLMYDQSLAINGADIAAEVYAGASGAYTYTFTAAEDGDLVISKAQAAAQLYIKSVTINVPVIFDEDTVIDLGAFTGKIEGTVGEFAGIEIDATNGKFATNGDNTWAQVNAGTVLRFNVAEGAVITLNTYSNSTDYTLTVEGGVATITATANIYIGKINIEVAAVEKTTYVYSYVAGAAAFEGTWGASGTGEGIEVTNNVTAYKSDKEKSTEDGSITYTYCAETKALSGKHFTVTIGEGITDATITVYASHSTKDDVRTLFLENGTETPSSIDITNPIDSGKSPVYLYTLLASELGAGTYNIYSDGATVHVYAIIITYTK